MADGEWVDGFSYLVPQGKPYNNSRKDDNDPDLAELIRTIKELMKEISKLTKVSGQTFGGTGAFGDYLNQMNKKEEARSKMYTKEQKEFLDKSEAHMAQLKAYIESNQTILDEFRKNSKKMTEFTEEMVFDRKHYDNRVADQKRTSDTIRKQQNEHFGSNVGKFALDNLFGPSLISALVKTGAMKSRLSDDLAVQGRDRAAIKNAGAMRTRDMDRDYFENYVLGRVDPRAKDQLDDAREGLVNEKVGHALASGSFIVENAKKFWAGKGAQEQGDPVVYGEAPEREPLGLPRPGRKRDNRRRTPKPSPHGSAGDNALMPIPGAGAALAENAILMGSFSKKSAVHPTASDVANKAPIAFSQGFLLLHDDLVRKEDMDRANADMLADAEMLSGAKNNGILGDVLGSALGGMFAKGSTLLKSIAAALPEIMAIALPALIAGGTLLLLVNGVMGFVDKAKEDRKARDAETKAAIDANPALKKKYGSLDLSTLSQEESVQLHTLVTAGPKGAAAGLQETMGATGTLDPKSPVTQDAIAAAKSSEQTDPFAFYSEQDLSWMPGGGLFYWKKEKDGYYFSSDGKSNWKKYSLADWQKQALMMRNGQDVGPNGLRTGASSYARVNREAVDGFESRVAKGPYKFHTGGVVPGPYGQETDITAMGGEAVISPPESREFASNLQTLVSTLSSKSQNEDTKNFETIIELITKDIALQEKLLAEMKRNTDITDKKELKVEAPPVTPTPSRQFASAV